MAATQAPQRTELYLCLSRAFLTPHDDGFLAALAEDLPADLEALLGGEATEAIATLQRAAHSIPDARALRQGYTALFLTPPYRAPLNAGLQLEGTINGAAVQGIRACYQRHSLERAESFRDLPDHLAVQLEFAAYLWAQPGDEETLQELHAFLTCYVAPWLPELIRQLKAELPNTRAAALYLSLAEIAHGVADADRRRLPAFEAGVSTQDPKTRPTPTTSLAAVASGQEDATEQVRCPRCRSTVTLRGAAAAVYRRLEAAGAHTAHLSVCHRCQATGLRKPQRRF